MRVLDYKIFKFFNQTLFFIFVYIFFQELFLIITNGRFCLNQKQLFFNKYVLHKMINKKNKSFYKKNSVSENIMEKLILYYNKQLRNCGLCSIGESVKDECNFFSQLLK